MAKDNREERRTITSRRLGALRLRSKMVIGILSVVVLLFASVISYVAFYSGKAARKSAEELALASVRDAANEIEITVKENVAVLNAIANMVKNTERTALHSRKSVLQLMSAAVTQTPQIVSLWLAFEPDAFDGRDEAFHEKDGYGKNGQFVACFVNQDGKAKRTQDVTSETIYEPNAGDYYLVPLKTGNSRIKPPEFFTFQTGQTTLISSISVPIELDGKIAGVVGMDFNYASIQKFVESLRLVSENASFSLVAYDGTVIQTKKPEMIGKNLGDLLKGEANEMEVMRAVREGSEYRDIARSLQTDEKSLRVFTPTHTGIEKESLSVVGIIPEADVLAASRRMTRNIVLVAFVGLIVLGGVVYLISGRIVRPLIELSGILQRSARLDFTTDSSHAWLLDYRDEIGDMVHSYVKMKDSLTDMLRSLNLEARSFGSSAQTLAAISEESVASMEEVKSSLDEVARLSNENISALEHTNTGVDEVAHASSATATSAEEGAAIARRTTELTRQAFTEVGAVVDAIRKAGERSRDSGQSIGKVNDSVGAIVSFVSTITGIADQTNLLALNAAIEAARAGEAGRGFAVVAEEVRKLAEESSQAALEVQKLISVLQSDSGKANSVIDEMEALLEETIGKAGEAQDDLNGSLIEVDKLSGHMQTIASAAEEQAASSGEMANSVGQVTSATAEIGRALGNIQGAASETAAASENVATEAQGVAGGVQRLEDLLSRFRYDREERKETKGTLSLRVGD